MSLVQATVIGRNYGNEAVNDDPHEQPVQRQLRLGIAVPIRSETRRVLARRVVTRRYRREKYCARPCECWRHFLEKQSVEDRIYHLRCIARDAIDPTGRCCAVGNDNSRSRASSW